MEYLDSLSKNREYVSHESDKTNQQKNKQMEGRIFPAIVLSNDVILPFRNIKYVDLDPNAPLDTNQEDYQDYVTNWKDFPNFDNKDPRFIFYKNLKNKIDKSGIQLTVDHLKSFLNRRHEFPNKLYKGEYERGIVNLSNFHFNAAKDQSILERLNTNRKFKDSNRYHKFITWNVHSFSAPCINAKFTKDGIISAFGHNESTNLIADFLRELDPDVCIMQEFSANIRVPGPPNEGGKNRYPVRTFFDTYNSKTDGKFASATKKPLIEQVYTVLDAPMMNRYNNIYLFNALFTKYAVMKKEAYVFPSHRQYIKCKLLMDGNEVEVYNIHPESENITKEANAADIKSLADTFTDTDTYERMIIIAGDFNSTHVLKQQDYETGDEIHRPYENPHNYLKKKNFYNIYDILNHGRTEYDFTGYNGTIIDYIYVSVKFLNAYQIDFEIINTNLSDHYPVIMYMSPRNQTKDYPVRTIKGFIDIARSKEEFENIFSDVSLDIMNTNFFLINDFIKRYGYEIVQIPKGSLFCHSTKHVNFNGTTVPWEYTEHLERTTGNKDFNPNEKSTVSIMYISETFSSYYGYVAPNAMARMIYFRTKHDVSFIKLSGDTVKERIDIRMKFYKRLIEWIVEHNPRLKSHYVSYHRSPWAYQKIIQMFMSNLLSKIYEYEDDQDYCNVPCGILIADVINDEATKFSKSTRSILGQWFWDKGRCELYEGLEFQWYAWQYHLEYVGTDYLGDIYVPDLKTPDPVIQALYKNGVAVGTNVKRITDLTILAKNIDTQLPFISMSGNISTYNVTILMLRRLKECYENMFNVSYYAKLERTYTEVNIDWFRHVFHPADERMDFAHKLFSTTLLNLNINDFFIVLLNAKFFYRKVSDICETCDPTTAYDMNSLQIDYHNVQTKKVSPILYVFYQYVITYYKKIRDNMQKNSLTGKTRSVLLDVFDYIYAMTNIAIQFGVANSYLNIPILTMFKIVGDIDRRIINGEIVNQDISRSVDVIVNFLGKDFMNNIMKQKRIQLVRYDLLPVDKVSLNQTLSKSRNQSQWDPESVADERMTKEDSSESHYNYTDAGPLRLAGKTINKSLDLSALSHLDEIYEKIEQDRSNMDIELFEKYSSSSAEIQDILTHQKLIPTNDQSSAMEISPKNKDQEKDDQSSAMEVSPQK